MQKKNIEIPLSNNVLNGELTLVDNPIGIAIFAHGSGSSRFSKRNQLVAKILNEQKISTLLFDLLTNEEEELDKETLEYRFNIQLLSKRLLTATKWIQSNPNIKNLKIGYFGASTGAAAALIAASSIPNEIKAIVSRGGRPDLANSYLSQISSPTLLIVGELDFTVLKLNEEAYNQINCEKDIKIIKNATHVFEEGHSLEEVAMLASKWFEKYFLSK
ncbi:MAG: putative phosphoribosyl transferase [Candidatus Anoxychlamydiales bacterium]|nr:putative phosphoribosyl transferase [Candidatus Anoxychlamydiales bacterium]